jgi:isopenicillin N synthase-like dioxygenase
LRAGYALDTPRFFAHRDIVTIAILATWFCGFQRSREDSEMIGPDEKTEESWRWVEPLPGYTLVNLGDAMPIFINKKLKSGKHRVVTAYRDQS